MAYSTDGGWAMPIEQEPATPEEIATQRGDWRSGVQLMVADAATGRDWSILPACGVGDVTSDARGSGARFNSGKPPVELIPVWLIAISTKRYARDGDVWEILRRLGDWQRGLIPASGIIDGVEDWFEDCAAVFNYGRKKYAEWNWAKGMKWSVPLACAVRHCLAILRGEENDPESGLPHRGHIACNLVMLAQYESSYPEGDDRPWRLLQPAAEKSA